MRQLPPASDSELFFCEGCDRISQMMVYVGAGALPCSVCGRTVFYPQEGDEQGKDNCRWPAVGSVGAGSISETE